MTLTLEMSLLTDFCLTRAGSELTTAVK